MSLVLAGKYLISYGGGGQSGDIFRGGPVKKKHPVSFCIFLQIQSERTYPTARPAIAPAPAPVSTGRIDGGEEFSNCSAFITFSERFCMSSY